MDVQCELYICGTNAGYHEPMTTSILANSSVQYVHFLVQNILGFQLCMSNADTDQSTISHVAFEWLILQQLHLPSIRICICKQINEFF